MEPDKLACFCDGERVDLTAKEFQMVNALARHPGVVRDRAALRTAAYADTTDVSPRVIDKMIARIRQKFRALLPDVEIIETRSGLGYSISPERRENHLVELTETEFLILQALVTRPGVVKTRDSLMDAAYDDQIYVDEKTIDGHIKRIRNKFKKVDEDFNMIETLHGVGYRFKEA